MLLRTYLIVRGRAPSPVHAERSSPRSTLAMSVCDLPHGHSDNPTFCQPLRRRGPQGFGAPAAHPHGPAMDSHARRSASLRYALHARQGEARLQLQLPTPTPMKSFPLCSNIFPIARTTRPPPAIIPFMPGSRRAATSAFASISAALAPVKAFPPIANIPSRSNSMANKSSRGWRLSPGRTAKLECSEFPGEGSTPYRWRCGIRRRSRPFSPSMPPNNFFMMTSTTSTA